MLGSVREFINKVVLGWGVCGSAKYCFGIERFFLFPFAAGRSGSDPYDPRADEGNGDHPVYRHRRRGHDGPGHDGQGTATAWRPPLSFQGHLQPQDGYSRPASPFDKTDWDETVARIKRARKEEAKKLHGSSLAFSILRSREEWVKRSCSLGNLGRHSRAAMGALGAAGLGFVLFGPRGSKDRTDGRIVLDYWEKWTGLEGKAMQKVVNDFNASQSRIFVRYFSTGGIDEKAQIAIAGGAPPDILGLWNYNIPGFAETGAIQPLDELEPSALRRQAGDACRGHAAGCEPPGQDVGDDQHGRHASPVLQQGALPRGGAGCGSAAARTIRRAGCRQPQAG